MCELTPQIRFFFCYLYLLLTPDAFDAALGLLFLLPQWCTSWPDFPTSMPTQIPVTIDPPLPMETGLVWLPTVEMMDWRLTYGKGWGPSSKQMQSCIKYEGGKGKHSLPFGGGRVDRYVVDSARVKSPPLTCCFFKGHMFMCFTQANSHLNEVNAALLFVL